MLRNIYVCCIVAILIGFCLRCAPAVPPPPVEIRDSTSVDTSVIEGPDTTIIIPDTITAEPLPTKNFDSTLAFTRRFGTEYLFTQQQTQVQTGFYSTANDYRGTPVKLDYSFVAPAQDTMAKRPFILMVHEGAFLFGTLENEMGKAQLMARRGYAAASINYRLGFNGGSENFACGGNNMEVVYAVYRAVQDTYSALHYFAENAAKFRIDTTQMILAGSSAGAITVTALQYMTESDFEALQPGIVSKLGKLDTKSGQKHFTVRALLSYLGYGIFKSGYVTAATAIPTVFFQRIGDDVLPFQRGTFLSCPNYLSLEGAQPVTHRLRLLKVPYELNYQLGTGHSLSYTEEYLTSRYAQFMKRLWADDRRQIENEDKKVTQDILIR